MQDENDPISKSQRKRDMADLRELGSRLTEFSEDALRGLDIPDTLLDALLAAKRITAHGARKRQLGYIGKLLATIDAQPLHEIVQEHDHQHLTGTRAFHRIEQLRDQLLATGDQALPEVLATFPHAERSRLRKLLRQAQQEQQTGQPRGAARALFRYLRELQEGPGY